MIIPTAIVQVYTLTYMHYQNKSKADNGSFTGIYDKYSLLIFFLITTTMNLRETEVLLRFLKMQLSKLKIHSIEQPIRAIYCVSN